MPIFFMRKRTKHTNTRSPPMVTRHTKHFNFKQYVKTVRAWVIVTFRVPYGHIFIDSINTARLSRTEDSLSHPLPTTTTTIILLEVKVIFTEFWSNLSSCKESPEKNLRLQQDWMLKSQRKPRKNFLRLLKLVHNCEDHFHFYSVSTVHIYDLYHMHIISILLLIGVW